MLPVTVAAVPWPEVAARLRPFVARRVDGADVDDVLQEVATRIHRGLATLRDDERLDAWLFQIARNAIADHGRVRARHPLVVADRPEPSSIEAGEEDERVAARALAGCVAVFVARLPSPYREAITLVELEGRTAREAAALVGISGSGMKSRVQRGRAQLRALLDACCRIAVDARGKVTGFEPRPVTSCSSGCGRAR